MKTSDSFNAICFYFNWKCALEIIGHEYDNVGLALENPQLFGRFIPNLSPTCSEQLPELIREAQMMSQAMWGKFEEPADLKMDFDSRGTTERGKKRSFEDVFELPAATASSSKQFAQTGENSHND